MSFTVTRAPLRVSLFGGGTDRPDYYKKTGKGAVISFAIDKYMHLTINKVENKAVKVMYSQIETVNNLSYLKHDIVRETWREWKLGYGWEIASFADLPTVGTGLGSSSSFTVALVEALRHYDGFNVRNSCWGIAEAACDIEMKLCGSPIGKQDQYAAAFGGFNKYTFHKDEEVDVAHITLTPDTDLQSKLMLFYTGITRNTNEMITQQKVEGSNLTALNALYSQVDEAYTELKEGNLYRIGELLHEGWKLKSCLPGVVNPTIIDIYQKARDAGAVGGKVLGAGGGGFMLFYVEPEYQSNVREALTPLKETRFAIDGTGVQTLYSQR